MQSPKRRWKDQTTMDMNKMRVREEDAVCTLGANGLGSRIVVVEEKTSL